VPGDAGNPRTRRFADVRWLAETGSTNADALALARGGAAEGIVLVADHQTAGRGRLGRSWTAPPRASLLTTVLLRPDAAAAELCTMAVALSMADAVASTTGVDVRLKWPNDLVVAIPDDTVRKLAGVLAEADWSDAARPAVAVGIGVNCNWPPVDEVPAELAGTLASLNHLTGAEVDRGRLLDAHLDALERRYPVEPASLVAEWRTRSATLGRAVRLELPDGTTHEGTATDVTDDGRLVVDGRAFTAGDVTHLRPA